MSVIGYIRVSSNKQTLEHQQFEIENFANTQKIKKMLDCGIPKSQIAQKLDVQRSTLRRFIQRMNLV